MATDWIPKGMTPFSQKTQQTLNYVIPKKIPFGFVESTPWGDFYKNELLPTASDFSSAYGAWVVPETRTRAISAQLKAAREKFEPVYRQLATILRANPAVLPEDLVSMGLPPRREGGGTPSPKADMPPAYSLEILPGNRVRLHFSDASSDHKRAKPAGQHGIEIAWGIFDTPRDIFRKDLNRSSFDTRSPFTFELEDTDSGKHLYFSLRWENTRGEKGPWTPIAHVPVP